MKRVNHARVALALLRAATKTKHRGAAEVLRVAAGRKIVEHLVAIGAPELVKAARARIRANDLEWLAAVSSGLISGFTLPTGLGEVAALFNLNAITEPFLVTGTESTAPSGGLRGAEREKLDEGMGVAIKTTRVGAHVEPGRIVFTGTPTGMRHELARRARAGKVG